jgi:hypothetical protein
MEAMTGVPAFAGYRMGFPTERVALDLELLAPEARVKSQCLRVARP